MKSISIAWIILGLILLSSAVEAEGNCPPGYYSIGAPQGQAGPQGCAPIPRDGSSQQQPQIRSPVPQWEDHWGAIATALPMGVLGVANNFTSQSGAEQAAVADCQSKGASTCKIDLSYRNQCVAMIVGHPGYNVTPGANIEGAVRTGLKTCVDAGDTNCHVYFSACSLPQRVQ